MKYKRIMLKLSGEALGENGILFDHRQILAVAQVIKDVVQAGVQVGIVIGAGNLWRGRHGAGSGMDAVKADQMGMLGTLMNCLVMQDALRQAGLTAPMFSALHVPNVCESYRADAADAALSTHGAALFGGGLGNPFFTTDTAVSLRAIELKAEALLLAKNIDGVYTADPRQDPEAVLLRDITYQEAIGRKLKVMDLSALLLCAEQGLPQMRVFALSTPENIKKVLAGDDMGTVLHP